MKTQSPEKFNDLQFINLRSAQHFKSGYAEEENIRDRSIQNTGTTRLPIHHGVRDADPNFQFKKLQQRKLNLSDAQKCRFNQVYTDHSGFILFCLQKLGASEEQLDDLLVHTFLCLLHNLDRVQVGKEKKFLLLTARDLVIPKRHPWKSKLK